MSSWLWPTTADVGMRVFAPTLQRLLEDAALGTQNYLMSPDAAQTINQHMRYSGEWRVRSPHDAHDTSLLFVAWLDEIIYRAEVHSQWLVDVQCRVDADEHGQEIVAHAEWVDADQIEREIEIKAVTTHRLVVQEIETGVLVQSEWPEVPSFEGPGWYADVVFDI